MTATAKLFMHGRSQAVRLPKEFRLPGTEVRVSRLGHKIVLEPLASPSFDAEAWWASLDAMGASEFMAEDIPQDQPVGPDKSISFE